MNLLFFALLMLKVYFPQTIKMNRFVVEMNNLKLGKYKISKFSKV